MTRFGEVDALLRVARRLRWLGHMLNLLGACVAMYTWYEVTQELLTSRLMVVAGFFVCAALMYELSKRRAGAAATLLLRQELAELTAPVNVPPPIRKGEI